MQFPTESQGSPMPGVHVWRLSYSAAAVVSLGLLARIYLWINNPIINPDGFLYIQQAKALHFGLFDQVLDCYHYLSPYPLFIAVVYHILGNWVVAAQWVNIFFGTLTIIPLYWLMKRFFQDSTAWVSVMVFALLPAFVLVSRDVLRGPTFWFFAVSGLYLFILHVEKRHPRLLFLSSLCFAVGAWSRIEGSLFIIASSGFLLFMNPKHRWKDLAVFLAPYVTLTLVGILLAHLKGIDLAVLLRPERVLSRPMEFLAHYEKLRLQLKSLYDTDMVSAAPFFFPRVRNLVWLIALGTLVVQMAETLLYLFFILLVVGCFSWTARLKTDRRVTYLWTLSMLALALLYSQIIHNWVMTSRFLAVFLLPSFVFMGAGIERGASFLAFRYRLSGNMKYGVMVMIILILLLPKTIKANFKEDKLVFREIASFIAQREDHFRSVKICGAFKRIGVIHFFTNLNSHEAPCPRKGTVLHRTDGIGLNRIANRNYNYFVWDQKNWENMDIETNFPDRAARFKKLHEWSSDSLGKLVLYEVLK